VRTNSSNSDSPDWHLDSMARAPHTAVMGPELDPAAWLATLRDDLGHRRMAQGEQLMERLRPQLESLEARPGGGVLLGLAAQWVDAGFDEPGTIERLLARFPHETRGCLPLGDYLHLRMAEGAIAMAAEDFEAASAHLELVLRFADEVEDAEMFAIANFWLGRALRKQGRYDEALEYTERAERLALGLGYAEMAAIMQVTLSWLAFQKGKLHEANRILRSAEEALNRTDDFLSRGNVQSAYGRIARRQGKYEAAVERFEGAIAEFRRGGGGPLALARTLVNLGFVQRLLAVRAQKDLDHMAAVRRGSAVAAPDPSRGERIRIEQMREGARQCLAEASEIYERHQNHRGIAAVRITTGFLHLDAGDLERASAEASEAFTHANGKSDAIIMARARTLQCIVENAAIEEQLGEAASHREAAELYAREAVSLAGHTENRRLLARALVWQGLTFTIEPADAEAARRCCEQAMALLQPEAPERQYVWEELETLKNRVLHAQPVENLLRAWSAGIVEGQTFQQITEEFARIVIQRVWEREGRKVSRVAGRLSISPKKVRRILHAAGLNERHDD
jgi:tetratricopeptide (TPR) repeat protein